MARTITLPINIGCAGGNTLQEEIYGSIRRSILDGLVGGARRLPSTRALAAHLGVSRTTVLLAVEHLQAEGYLVSRRGSGTFVADDLPDDCATVGKAPKRTSRPRAAPAAGRLERRRGIETPPPIRSACPVEHPTLSVRGRALAGARTPDRRGPEPNRAFRLGTPALDLFPLPLWSRLTQHCARLTRASQLDYAPLCGLHRLREAIAEQVRSRGTKCDPAQVIVVAGAQRALDLVFHLAVDPGDSVWMEEPGYPGAHSAFLAAGADVLPIPVDAHGINIPEEPTRASDRNGQAAPDRNARAVPDRNARADTAFGPSRPECVSGNAPRVRLAYVTPSHQFPTGVAMSLERRRKLLAWAARARAWIVEDDYDCDFRYRVRPLPCLHALDTEGRVIYIGSFSKTLFPALRMGFLIAPPDLAGSIASARLGSDVHPPVLEQSVLAEFMIQGHYERHLRRMRSAYLERLDVLQRSIQASGAPLRLRPVHTGLHAVADLEGVDAERVTREAAARGIEVMPLSHYYFDSGPRENALVLGFASVRPEAIRAGLLQLTQAIEAARRPAAAR